MKKYRLTIILALVLLVLSLVSISIGAVDIKFSDIFKDPTKLRLLLVSRLPRLLAILCTGVGMSISGLIMQNLCSNKFVSPSTGATISGAQLGILLALIIIPSSSMLVRSLFAFVISLLSTLAFVFFITRIRLKDPVMVPLIGIMLSNIILGITNFIAYKFEATQTISSYLTGSFAGVVAGKYEIVYFVVPLIVLSFIFANHFNIVGMGKDFSKNLGVNYNVILILGLCICSLITASIVVVVGSISYIGLIIPNIIVMLKGDKLKGTLSFAINLIIMVILAYFIYGAMFKKTKYNVLYILLIGTVLSSLFGSIQSAIVRIMDSNEYDTLLTSLTASFDSINTEIIITGVILLALVTIILYKDIKMLNVITLGKEQAINLGVNYDRVIRRLLIGVTIYIAIATAMVGPISFLGLITANLARLSFKTYKHSYLISGTAGISIIVLIIGQVIVERVVSYSIPISVFITIGGGIYFLFLIIKSGRRA